MENNYIHNAEALFPLMMEVQRLSLSLDSENPFHKNRYTSLRAYQDALHPLLEKYGMYVTWDLESTSEGDSIRRWLIMRVYNASGLIREYPYPLNPAATPQALGSEITYAKRYSLVACFNFRQSKDEDDDGNAASGISSSAPIARKVPNIVKL